MTTKLGVNKIELSEDGISVEWNDGHTSHYDAKYLRINCGCAECVEEWSQRKILDPVSVPADIRAEDHLMVGRYAVQFLWSDAHYTGLYPFRFLRSVCTCIACNQARDKAGIPG